MAKKKKEIKEEVSELQEGTGQFEQVKDLEVSEVEVLSEEIVGEIPVEKEIVEEVKVEVSEDLVVKANALVIELGDMYLGGPGQKALTELKAILSKIY